MSLTGSIFGPYDSPLPKGACEIPDWTAAGEAIAAKDGYSRTAFDDIVIATPSDGVCPYAGIGNFGSRGVRLDGTFNVGVIAHELGHNFSLAHAGTLACGTASIGGTCTADQYGDPFDDMGGRRRRVTTARSTSACSGGCPTTKSPRSRAARRRSRSPRVNNARSARPNSCSSRCRTARVTRSNGARRTERSISRWQESGFASGAHRARRRSALTTPSCST